MKRHIALLAVLVTAIGLSSFAQDAQWPDQIRSASESLTAYSATLRMIRHDARGDSAISFTFEFVPSDRMRIVYSAPSSVEGQTMILNGDRFYTYIPTLNRRIWQDVDDDSDNQGEEMGFLYDFVTRSAGALFDDHPAAVTAQAEGYVLEETGETVETIELSFQLDGERQVVRVRLDDLTPVAVDIFRDDALVMEIRVLAYCLNGEIDPSRFEIPSK